MTEEQIKQKARKHADAYATPDLEDSFRVYIYEANKDGYIAGATEATKELQEQIEKLIDFVLSRIECCDVCPITDTCINSEGTCSYAGILAKGEEEVTREWLMQFISRR